MMRLKDEDAGRLFTAMLGAPAKPRRWWAPWRRGPYTHTFGRSS